MLEKVVDGFLDLGRPEFFMALALPDFERSVLHAHENIDTELRMPRTTVTPSLLNRTAAFSELAAQALEILPSNAE